jgi:DNA replication and repair protein RecF
MIATRLTLRDFRSYAAADVQLGAGLSVVTGRNGTGKTNLLEAIYFACTGRSCRTANERECVRFGAALTRLELRCEQDGQEHELSVGFQPGHPKRLCVDGAPVERLTDVTSRPLVSVFLPDRLELVTGAPALRRAHLDQVVAALRPARAATRRAYSAALAQRNALVAAIRAGRAGRGSLPAWDAELARHGVALMADRAAVVEELRPRFAQHDELVLRRDDRELRAYGSRGQQRLALLALLLAEREALAESRGTPPLMLLDDVMSELDAGRRSRLVDLLRTGGQSLITTTDLAHVPGGDEPGVTRLAIAEGAVLQEAA